MSDYGQNDFNAVDSFIHGQQARDEQSRRDTMRTVAIGVGSALVFNQLINRHEQQPQQGYYDPNQPVIYGPGFAPPPPPQPVKKNNDWFWILLFLITLPAAIHFWFG